MIIQIEGLVVDVEIGLYQWEKGYKRPIKLNIEIELSSSNFAIKDIRDTLDYDVLTEKVTFILSQRRFDLIEEVCFVVGDLVVKDKNVKKCKVCVEKPNAIKQAKSVSVSGEFYA